MPVVVHHGEDRMIGADGKRVIAVDSSLSSDTVRSRITVSADLEKYFKGYDFFSRHDAEIADNRSILDIPVLSMILPVAWLTGADVHVRELDRRFANSMETLHRAYKAMYPKLPFRTKLIADRLVDNDYAVNEKALLFSGGLDSTYSLFENIALKPRLIMIFGTYDIPILNVPFQETLEKEYSALAERENLTLNFIRTNALELLDFGRLGHLFWRIQGKPEEYVGYWQGIGYMLCHIGQAAPLSIGRFSHLLVASGVAILFAPNYPTAECVARSARGGIRWANVSIEWNGEILRHEKAFFLKKFLEAYGSKLRVCVQPESQWSRDLFDCSHCEKCLLAITMLVAAGIDPAECGFSMDRSTFNRAQKAIRDSSAREITVSWKPLQRTIPDVIGLDRYGARQFFDWFRKIDLDSMGQRIPLSNLYFRSPYPIAHILRSIWYRTGADRLRSSARLR